MHKTTPLITSVSCSTRCAGRGWSLSELARLARITRPCGVQVFMRQPNLAPVTRKASRRSLRENSLRPLDDPWRQLHLDHTVALLSKRLWNYTTTRDTTQGKGAGVGAGAPFVALSQWVGDHLPLTRLSQPRCKVSWSSPGWIPGSRGPENDSNRRLAASLVSHWSAYGYGDRRPPLCSNLVWIAPAFLWCGADKICPSLHASDQANVGALRTSPGAPHTCKSSVGSDEIQHGGVDWRRLLVMHEVRCTGDVHSLRIRDKFL